jgi:Family of unknown function (DUF6084)
MPDLDFHIEGVETVPFAAVPMIRFHLRVGNRPEEEKIHTIALRCQIQIEAARRKYTPEEQTKLRDLFGEPERWSQTLRNRLWMHVNSVVPAFTADTRVEMQVPCSFDFNVGATKYFYGLDDGEIPLVFQFSGTVFYNNSHEELLVAPISWDREAKFRLPLKTWRETMEIYYPNSAWLCLRRDIFDRLYQYKVRNGIPTWEQTLENVLSSVEETVGS